MQNKPTIFNGYTMYNIDKFSFKKITTRKYAIFPPIHMVGLVLPKLLYSCEFVPEKTYEPWLDWVRPKVWREDAHIKLGQISLEKKSYRMCWPAFREKKEKLTWGPPFVEKQKDMTYGSAFLWKHRDTWHVTCDSWYVTFAHFAHFLKHSAP